MHKYIRILSRRQIVVIHAKLSNHNVHALKMKSESLRSGKRAESLYYSQNWFTMRRKETNNIIKRGK